LFPCSATGWAAYDRFRERGIEQMRIGVLVLAAAASVWAQAPSAEEQIAAAVQAAPAELRATATVLGYDEKGELKTLRAGTGDLVCLADNPKVKGFEVDCYHKDLEPFMKRGRELAATGLSGKARHEQRNKDIADGKVPMPKEPRMLYVMTGEGFDATAGKVTNAFLRWVIYVSGAKPETIGLPTKGATEPWLMYPGEPGAHIMITPPRAAAPKPQP
jgi:hypothetical protein